MHDINHTMDTSNDSMAICNDTQDNDSISQPKSPNANEEVRSSVEDSFTNMAERSDFVVSNDHSLDTDDIVRNLVEHTISNEAVSPLNDPVMSTSSSLDTNDIVNNVIETETTNLQSNDEVLDSMLESIEDEHELQDSVAVDDSSVLEEDNLVPDFSHENSAPSEPNGSAPVPASDRLCQLPLGRIKTIVKADPEVNVISADVTFLISKSCELFLQWLGKEVHSYTVQKKKKTIQKRDLDLAISEHPTLEFLDGALD